MEIQIALKYYNKNNVYQVCGYEKTNKHTKKEFKKIIDDYNKKPMQDYIYQYFEECPMEDIKYAFILRPEKSDVQETMEKIEDMLNDVTREFENLKYDLEKENKND